jgi:NhaP-type Na+/H+ or K+/H+ antiporter
VNDYTLSLLVVGLLLLFVTLGSGWITRLPLSYALIYLVCGIALSPYGFGLIEIRPGAELLERLTEFVVLISLFSCGLKMNRPLKILPWNSTIRLIGLLMPISIFGVAAIAHWGFGLAWGPAVLLGAILAPTDPVLASEVQLSHLEDQDELRFGLTSEGGLNDALAFPFVYFGLHWLKDGQWPTWLGSWVGVDVLWAIAAGCVMGVVVSRCIIWVDRRIQRLRPADSLMEDFVALSIVLITYALTEVVNGYGFIAVFIAGIVAQRSYRNPERKVSQLEFIETIEKLMEIGTILLLGSLLRIEPIVKYLPQTLIIAGALFFIIRPIGAWISTAGGRYQPIYRVLFGWFGIRGVGSLYYISYSLGSGLQGELGEQLAWITFTTVVLSVIIHGVTATPMMHKYERFVERQNHSPATPAVEPVQAGQ